MLRNKNQVNNKGFTLIELMVVISIIALLTSIGLIAFQSARQKSRNVKRLGDMTQMNTALELYFAANRGYPSSTSGVPTPLMPTFASSLPTAPTPPDGVCDGLNHDPAVTLDHGNVPVMANTYYYIPTGSPYDAGYGMVYPSYVYYFCIGQDTGNFSAGERLLTPAGVR